MSTKKLKKRWIKKEKHTASTMQKKRYEISNCSCPTF